MNKRLLPMNLQFFANQESTGTQDGGTSGEGQQQAAQTQSSSAQQPTIDYSKIQQMLEGTLAAKEDTALKAYFKQQGLSQEEMTQAIASFKQQKASQQPDINALQTQAAQAQAALQRAQVENKATLAALELGLEAKTIPYILKMADLSQVIGQDGTINEESLKAALNKVLEDIPQLKLQQGQTTGFVQVGAAGNNGQQQTSDDALKKAFGL